jgi:DNA-binding LytR/AlgR family response regulator
MNILILEDEKAAADRLSAMLKDANPAAVVVAVLESVKDAVSWLRANKDIDLIVSDIQLADGLSFEVFEQVQVHKPIIFTTAFDAYTLKAFKLNSIDYLLKPIDKEELKAALDKFASFHQPAPAIDIMSIFKQVQQSGSAAFKSRFLIKQGDRLSFIPATDAAYLRADDKVIFLHNHHGQKYIVDETLDELEKSMDPAVFYRINRSYIVHINSIDKIHTHFNGRLKIDLKRSDDNEIFVSRQRVSEFKRWLNR